MKAHPPRSCLPLALATLGACAPAPDVAVPVVEAPLLAELPSGVVYSPDACAAEAAGEGPGQVVLWLPGTGTAPHDYLAVLAEAELATGRCVVGLPTDAPFKISECCSLTGVAWDPLDARCLADQTAGKLHGAPGSFTCTDGTTHTTPWEKSVEGLAVAAARDLGLTRLLPEGGGPDDFVWERVVLGGHSAGAILGLEWAVAHRELAGVALVAGAVFEVEGGGGWPAWTRGRPYTPLARVRAFHHVADADVERRAGYAAVGLEGAQVRVTTLAAEPCGEWPHSCVVRDAFLPQTEEGEPPFVEDWDWLFEG